MSAQRRRGLRFSDLCAKLSELHLASTVLMLAGCAEQPEPETICVPDSGDTELKFGAAVIGVNTSDTIDFYFREVGACGPIRRA